MIRWLGLVGITVALLVTSTQARANTVPHDGFYRGTMIVKPGAESSEWIARSVTLGLTTNVDPSGGPISLSGAIRLYHGAFGSNEYTEQRFSQTSFNALSRQIRLRTSEGLTFVLKYFETDGALIGDVYSDALARYGKLLLVKVRE